MENMLFTVYRHPEGISLNGREYLLNAEGYVILFFSEMDLVNFFNGKIKSIEDAESKGLYIEDIKELYYYPYAGSSFKKVHTWYFNNMKHKIITQNLTRDKLTESATNGIIL